MLKSNAWKLYASGCGVSEWGRGGNGPSSFHNRLHGNELRPLSSRRPTRSTQGWKLRKERSGVAFFGTKEPSMAPGLAFLHMIIAWPHKQPTASYSVHRHVHLPISPSHERITSRYREFEVVASDVGGSAQRCFR